MNRPVFPTLAGMLLLVLPLLPVSPAAALMSRRTPEPTITRLHISKSKHSMEVYAGDTLLQELRVAIGPGGQGRKNQEGDKVTPVGRYHVVLRAPSRWKDFLLLDYPNAADRTRFAELKKSGALPAAATIGGQIGIHGAPEQAEWKTTHKDVDWTLGCVALNDDEITALAPRVHPGTIVDIDD